MHDMPVRQLKSHKRVVLDNCKCPYCMNLLTSGESNLDHVIGRKFVPKGKLARSWNLVLRACRRCNDEKGTLEDEISAITMQPTTYGDYSLADPLLKAEASRKGRGSRSHRTNKRVSESAEEVEIRLAPFPGSEATFTMICGPQLDRNRAALLAERQMQAFCYWITYDEAKRQGAWWSDAFMALQVAERPDWGNKTIRGFMDVIATWNTRLFGIAADGNFKVLIRRKPPNGMLWAWALEWNQSCRVVGFFGREDEIRAIESTLPLPPAHVFKDLNGNTFRMGTEEALPETEDTLFKPTDRPFA